MTILAGTVLLSRYLRLALANIPYPSTEANATATPKAPGPSFGRMFSQRSKATHSRTGWR